MKKMLCFLLSFVFTLMEAIATAPSLPEPEKSFTLTYIQLEETCSYDIVISTSCSSPTHSRDQISLAFGDDYGNQVFVPRLNDQSNSTHMFDRCSTDTFHIDGPCTNQICFIYLYRTGPDAWIPTTVGIFRNSSETTTFRYNVYIPNRNWYGFNVCGHPSSSNRLSSKMWFICGILVYINWFVLY